MPQLVSDPDKARALLQGRKRLDNLTLWGTNGAIGTATPTTVCSYARVEQQLNNGANECPVQNSLGLQFEQSDRWLGGQQQTRIREGSHGSRGGYGGGGRLYDAKTGDSSQTEGARRLRWICQFAQPGVQKSREEGLRFHSNGCRWVFRFLNIRIYDVHLLNLENRASDNQCSIEKFFRAFVLGHFRA